MTELWLGLALFVLPLACVLLWPALRGAGAQRSAAESKRAALATLYREQRAELQSARDSGALDQRQFTELEAEMGRNLLAAEASLQSGGPARGGRGLLFALAALLPLAALGIYFSSDHIDDLRLYREVQASHQGKTTAADEARLTRQLKARVESHPDDLTSRYVLAQRLLVAGDLSGAVESYRYVVQRSPEAAGVKAELAQALFFAAGSRITNEVRQLTDEVLEIQPNNGTALGLAGIAAFDRKDYRAARDHWKRALVQLSPDSAAAQALAAGVQRAEKALADSGQPAAETVASSAAPAAANGPSIRLHVSLGEGIEAKPDTPVFVYARGADSPMPLAIVRLRAQQLPADVVLDKSRAMMPSRSIAGADAVELVARLAVHGDARPAPGDWQGSIESLPKASWGEPQTIVIDRQL
ncbi:c-type cytochrome biogenesis protein CcmI [Microbulbifer sp. SAOS-129_SWC]|uniref:c-type cytochrome biogenesis protein CcmI n=1 Tax=Microbulbifer sp. SAOS-129_SWC TaxID=3145235 RepID=UPI0032174885